MSAWATIVMFSTVSISAARPSRTTGMVVDDQEGDHVVPPTRTPGEASPKPAAPDGIGPAQSCPPTSAGSVPHAGYTETFGPAI